MIRALVMAALLGAGCAPQSQPPKQTAPSNHYRQGFVDACVGVSDWHLQRDGHDWPGAVVADSIMRAQWETRRDRWFSE